MNSKDDGYPVTDVEDAVTTLEDLIDGGDEYKGRDTRISRVICFLKHQEAAIREAGIEASSLREDLDAAQCDLESETYRVGELEEAIRDYEAKEVDEEHERLIACAHNPNYQWHKEI